MTVIGIFVGGQARRMGGIPKGLLVTRDGTTVVERTVAIARELTDRIALVGQNEAYARALDLPSLPDPPGARGPLGGLAALLERAGAEDAVAVACDMPFITLALLRRLVDHTPHATAVAPRRGGRWESLFSRFSSARALPVVQRRLAEGALSMQGPLDELAAEPLPLLPDEEKLLSDWDRPEDVA